MNKLLSANFFRLRKNKCFRGSLAFMFVIGIASPLLRYRDMKQSGYINNLDNGFFMCALFIGIILAVFCSLFIGTEHNDGTIRNKIIVGQKRETIYLSNMVTCSIIAITMCIVFFVPYLSVGIPLLGFFVADMKMIVMIGWDQAWSPERFPPAGVRTFSDPGPPLPRCHSGWRCRSTGSPP